MTQLATSQVLDLAADKIQEHGWGQGPATWIGTGGFCLEGAIGAVVRVEMYDASLPNLSRLQRCPAYLAVCEYLDRPEHDSFLWEWNDAPERTAEDVIAVLRAAAAVERTKEAVASEVAA